MLEPITDVVFGARYEGLSLAFCPSYVKSRDAVSLARELQLGNTGSPGVSRDRQTGRQADRQTGGIRVAFPHGHDSPWRHWRSAPGCRQTLYDIECAHHCRASNGSVKSRVGGLTVPFEDAFPRAPSLSLPA